MIYSSFPQILQSPSVSDSFLKKLVHTELRKERQFTSRSPCQSPVLQNSLKLQTLGDLLLQVHHLIQQVLELQVIGDPLSAWPARKTRSEGVDKARWGRAKHSRLQTQKRERGLGRGWEGGRVELSLSAPTSWVWSLPFFNLMGQSIKLL